MPVPLRQEVGYQQEEIHVQPLTIKFTTAANLRVFEFEFEFGTLVLNCTLLLGVQSHFKHRGGFLLAFLDYDYLLLSTSG